MIDELSMIIYVIALYFATRAPFNLTINRARGSEDCFFISILLSLADERLMYLDMNFCECKLLLGLLLIS